MASPTQALSPSSPALHRYACVVAGSTLLLIFAGGLVTSTGSGLAVPDWPLSFGQFFPEMKGGVRYEHGHRMIAGVVGLLTVVLAVWVTLREPRAPVRWLARAAVAAVVLQAILGGVTVLYKLPPAVSVAHACLAQAFLCLAVALAAVTSPRWPAARLASGEAAPARMALVTAAAVYGQLILGAVMRHTGAGLAIATFPLADGRLVPPLDDPAVEIHFAHRVMAAVVAVLVAWTAARSLTGGAGWLRRPAILLLVLAGLQVTLGAATVWSRKQPLVTTAHVAGGAALLATSVVLWLRSRRLQVN